MIRLFPLTFTTPVRALLLCLCLHGAAQADDFADVSRLHEAGQTGAALTRADQFLATKPKDAQMRFLKGVMLAESRRESEAIDLFGALTEDHPDLAEPYNNLAALYAAVGDYDKARATLEQALRTNPSYVTAHENLGDIYAMLASQSYARALKLDPNQATLLMPKLALVRELFAPKADSGSTRFK